MPSRKRGRKSCKPPTDPKPSSSKTSTAITPAGVDSQGLSEDAVSVAGPETELGELTLQARLDVTHAQIVVSDLGRKGHSYERPIVKGNARAHLGDVHNVYNFHQPSADAPVDSEETELMKALAFDRKTNRLMSVTRAYAETCSWIFDRPEYSRWRDPDQRKSHRGVLWIKGKAGTGKSTLMSCLCDRDCQRDCEEITVSFFFNARSPDTLVKSTEGMYRCLLYQIMKNLPRLEERLSRLHLPRSEGWPIELLENALRSVILGLSAEERITCFVDALDECKIEDVRKAIDRFEDLAETITTKNIHFRICFSSRYYPQITMRHHEELKLDVQQEHMQDISRYIDQKLTIPGGSKLELSSRIYHRCSGIFLWVVLVVKQLREKNDNGSTRSQLLATLDAIPEEIEELFAKIVAEPDDALASIVRWRLFSLRPLTNKELFFAVQASVGCTTTGRWDRDEIDEDGMIRYLLHASRGLMHSIPRERKWFHIGRPRRRANAISFIHESVREYFCKGGSTSTDRTSLHETKASGHAKLAEGCLSYLELVVDQPDFSTLCRSGNELLFMGYATGCILHHTEVAFASGVTGLGVLETFPFQQMMMFINMTPAWPGDDPDLEFENPSSLFQMLLYQQCPELARAILTQRLPFFAFKGSDSDQEDRQVLHADTPYQA
jgi:hypothetical protein